VRENVVVTDVDMKFTSMVRFMVKWAFASIPAVIIVISTVVVGAKVVGTLVGTAVGMAQAFAPTELSPAEKAAASEKARKFLDELGKNSSLRRESEK
jgi:hypothetical protein